MNDDAGSSTATVASAAPSAVDARRAQVVQVVGAPRAQRDGRFGRPARTELIGVDAERQPGERGRARDGRQIVERERDVLHVDVDLIGEPLGRHGGDQLVARRPYPSGT